MWQFLLEEVALLNLHIKAGWHLTLAHTTCLDIYLYSVYSLADNQFLLNCYLVTCVSVDYKAVLDFTLNAGFFFGHINKPSKERWTAS